MHGSTVSSATYGIGARRLHWAVATLILCQFLLGWLHVISARVHLFVYRDRIMQRMGPSMRSF
jgi:cytochrome b561